MENIALAKQFNDEVRKLIEFRIQELGETAETRMMLTKIRVVTATKPFLIFDLWCQYVFPYEKYIRERDETAWTLTETQNSEMFKSFGACDTWKLLSKESKSRIWEILHRLNTLCLGIYKKRRQYGAMDAVSMLMENLMSK